MFGYIATDSASLTKEEKDRYQEFYCGLCYRLGEEFGNIGRATLTYDMTFVIIMLSSLYEMEEQTGTQRCAIRPMKPHPYVLTPATEYAADMNMILAYYKCLDDVNDDHSIIAAGKSKLLEKHMPVIKRRYPLQCEVVESVLNRLTEMENSGELNPDIPANCFGGLMGELFIMSEDEFSPTLRGMGAALGRFVYLMDACNDLRADIKKKRYNPLVAQLDTNFEPILTMMIGECTTEFEKLPVKSDLNILRNILYSGVWTRYKSKREGRI